MNFCYVNLFLSQSHLGFCSFFRSGRIFDDNRKKNPVWGIAWQKLQYISYSFIHSDRAVFIQEKRTIVVSIQAAQAFFLLHVAFCWDAFYTHTPLVKPYPHTHIIFISVQEKVALAIKSIVDQWLSDEIV